MVFAINLPFNFLVEPFQYLQTHKNFVLSMIRLANQAVSLSQCIFTSNGKVSFVSYAILSLRKLEKLLHLW